MTPEKKLEINRVIAGELGLKLVPRIYGSMVVIEEGTTQADYYNSISDVLDAVDVICVSDTVPFQYAVTINKMNDGTFKAKITTYTSKKEYGFSEVKGTAETRPAAVALALVEYIEEGK